MSNPDPVYNSTTTTPTDSAKRCFLIPSDHLNMFRFIIKVLEVLMSFVAFVLEEVVNNCTVCGPLYFFEFVSCTAFLFTLLLLALLSTSLHQRVGISCWPTLDFWYTVVLAILFLLASIIFAANNDGSSLEKATVAFGFLATFAFIIDVGYFMKTKGLPCGKSDTVQNSTHPVPESEKLNTNGTS